MRYSITFTVATALCAVNVFAAPLEVTERGFSVPTVKKAFHKHHGPKAFDKALRKWGLTRELHNATANLELIPDAVDKRDGSVAAVSESGDVEYDCPVSIGTPAQTLQLDFDTGSADLWVFSTEQPTSQSAGHNVFNPSASSTFKRLSGYTWDISYADGSGASGDVGTDKVTVGGVTVTTQAVELAKTVSDQFTESTNDGLLGLAFGSINTVQPVQQKTFFENAMAGLTNKLFTAYLKHAATGSYDFGYIDTTKYTGTLKYTPVTKTNGFWQFPSTSYKVGSTTYTQTGTGIADTGTTLLLVSSTACQRYYASVPNAQANSQVGGYILPCSSNPTSVFSFAIGSGNFASVSGKNIVYGSSLGTIGGVPYCFGSIQPISSNMYIYGDTFFKQNFAVFDYGNTRFGFAPHSY